MPPRVVLLVFLQAVALSFAHPAGAQVQPVRSFPLNTFNRVLDGQWQGIRYASDGNVYFGSSTHSGHHGAAFFKYNPSTQQVTQLAADITLICGEDPDISPQGKLHSDIVEANGWLYFSTKFSSEKPGALGKWTGSHVIGYELATGAFRDYGVIHPKYDSYSGIGVDRVRNRIYVFVKSMFGSEPSYLYAIDAATDAKQNLGTLGDSIHTSMWIFVDQRGDGWFSLARDHGNLLRVRGDTGQIDVFPNALPPLYRWDAEQLDSSPLNQDYRWIHWMQPLDGDRALVFLGYEGGMLYMFDSTKPIAQAFTNIRHIGYTYYGLAIGDNGGRVYYYQRANRNTFGHQDFQDFHLKSVSLNPADGYAITDHGLIRDQDGRLVWRVPAMMTDGGSRVFMTGDWWTIPGDLGTLRYVHNGTAEYYEPLPRGQFFAAADLSTAAAIFITPPSATLHEGEARQFGATVTGVSDPAVTWSVEPPLGYVSTTGMYTAPNDVASAQTVHVIATSVADPAQSAYAVVALEPPPVSVSVSPDEATLGPGETQQFAAVVQNAANAAVTWTISPARGSIAANGVYTAPPNVPVAENVAVTAKSVADPTKLDTAVVRLAPPPPIPGTIRIDAGLLNSDYTDSHGLSWSRDAHFTGGQTVSGSGITGTSDPNLYRIAREGIYGGGFTYSIPAPNGSYRVTLKFTEFKMSRAGQRTFHVSINGEPVLQNFDILAEAALRAALDKSFDVNVSDGAIVIAFARVKSVPIVSAIEIVPAGPPPQDGTPPVRGNGAPSGALAAGTTQTTLLLTTNENAACRYSTTPGTEFALMTGAFGGSGGQTHQTTVSGLVSGQAYAFYVRCADGIGNANPDDYAIQFSVANPTAAAISITAPVAGATVSGLTQINAAVSGPNVLGVTFFVDGAQIGAEDTLEPFSAHWDTTTHAAGAAAVSARLRYGSPAQTLDSAAVNVTVDNSAPTGTTVLRLNGGRLSWTYTDVLGRVWGPDQYFLGGGIVSASTVSGTPDVHLYRVARSSLYADFGYRIPVEPGRYLVTLKFAETTYTKAGQRTFDVVINGATVLSNFDVLVAAGATRTAVDRNFTIDASAGQIAIDFVRRNQFGIVSAIEITPAP